MKTKEMNQVSNRQLMIVMDICLQQLVGVSSMNLNLSPPPAVLTTLVSFAGTLVLWVGQESPVQLGSLSLHITKRTKPGSHTFRKCLVVSFWIFFFYVWSWKKCVKVC